MTDQPGAPADAMATEDGAYVTIVSTLKGLRRAGGSFMESCAATGFYWGAVHLAGADHQQDG